MPQITGLLLTVWIVFSSASAKWPPVPNFKVLTMTLFPGTYTGGNPAFINCSRTINNKEEFCWQCSHYYAQFCTWGALFLLCILRCIWLSETLMATKRTIYPVTSALSSQSYIITCIKMQPSLSKKTAAYALTNKSTKTEQSRIPTIKIMGAQHRLIENHTVTQIRVQQTLICENLIKAQRFIIISRQPLLSFFF